MSRLNKAVKRILAAVLTAGLTCGGVYGGMIAYRTTNRMPVNVYSVSEIAGNTYYYVDEEQSYGSVQADRIQSCFLSSTQNVKEVMVTSGQQVKKGDPLYTFDTTLSEIQLARAENEFAQQELNLKYSKEDLDRINRLIPSAEGSAEEETAPEEPDSTPEEPEEEVYDPEQTGVRIDVEEDEDDETGGDGSFAMPYRYLWAYEDIIADDYLKGMIRGERRLSASEEETPGYYTDEQGDTEIFEPDEEEEIIPEITAFVLKNPFVTNLWADEVIREDDGEDVILYDDDEGDVYFEEDLFYEETPSEDYPSEDVPYAEENDPYFTDEDVYEEDVPYEEGNDAENPDPVQEETERTDEETMIQPSEETQEETADSIVTLEEETDSTITESTPEVIDPGDDTDVFVILEVHKFNNRNAPVEMKYGLHIFRVSNRISVQFYNPDAVEQNSEEDDQYDYNDSEEYGDPGDYGGYDDYADEADDSADDSGVKPAFVRSTIDMNAAYTAKEISELRTEKEKEIRDLTIAVRKSEITLREMRAELGDGTVRSKLDGVVKTVRDPEDAIQTGSALVQVSGGGGYFISVSVAELDLDKISDGQTATVSSFDTGSQMTGTVESISEFPSSSMDFWSSGNPNSSYYPCRIYLGDEVELREDDFVGVTWGNKDASSGKGFFIDTMFVRSESSGHYVFMRDEQGKLRKQTIQVGIVSTDATQVRGGITKKDYIAFPYGADCVEGAKTEEATYEQLYVY